jgi:hypothetical protein
MVPATVLLKRKMIRLLHPLKIPLAIVYSGTMGEEIKENIFLRLEYL